MKIWEIDWTDNKKYIDNTGLIWAVEKEYLGDLILQNTISIGDQITEVYQLYDILKMNFQEYNEQSQKDFSLKNDDLVEVFSDGKFIIRHFSEYTDTGILVWTGGNTSKTCNSRRHYTKWRIHEK